MTPTLCFVFLQSVCSFVESIKKNEKGVNEKIVAQEIVRRLVFLAVNKRCFDREKEYLWCRYSPFIPVRSITSEPMVASK